MKAHLALLALAAVSISHAQDPAPTPQEFRHQSLSGKDYSKADFGESKFFRVRLNGANFSGAMLVGTTFQQSDLAACDFTNAEFGPETKFRECTLNRANFENADLKGADFNRVNLRGANLRNTKGWGDVADCTFSEADIRGADFSSVKGALGEVQWSGAVYDDSTKFPAGVDPAKVGAEKASQ